MRTAPDWKMGSETVGTAVPKEELSEWRARARRRAPRQQNISAARAAPRAIPGKRPARTAPAGNAAHVREIVEFEAVAVAMVAVGREADVVGEARPVDDGAACVVVELVLARSWVASIVHVEPEHE